jgi:hypothetical protein
MSPSSNPGTPPGASRRQEVIDILCEGFARDAMPLDEFERRVELAHRVGSAAELDCLVADLPSPHPPAGAVAGPGSAPPGRFSPLLQRGAVRAREVVAAVMGGAGRTGRWNPARRTIAAAVMGGVELDFREAALPQGVTEVTAFAFWGAVEILVPPGVRLESNGIGIMGGFDHGEEVSEPVDPSAPVLRVAGVALMGGVEVKVRYPGETGRDARRRVRDERLRLRGGESG